MDKRFLDGVQKKLTEQREVIIASLSAQSDDLKKLVSTGDSGDVVDIASDAVDRTLLGSLNAQDSARLKAIEGALDRIRQGKYGLCIKCGKEIPQTRLKALPYAVMCISCTEAEERKRR